MNEERGALSVEQTRIAVNAQLEAQRMNQLCGPIDSVGEFLGVGNQLLSICIAAPLLVAPTIIDVDVLVAEVLESQRHQPFSDGGEDVLVDVASVFVP